MQKKVEEKLELGKWVPNLISWNQFAVIWKHVSNTSLFWCWNWMQRFRNGLRARLQTQGANWELYVFATNKPKKKQSVHVNVGLRTVKPPNWTVTEKWSISAGVIWVTDKELYVQHGVMRWAELHEQRGTHYVTGPITTSSWLSLGLQQQSLCGSTSRFHVSISKYFRAEKRT